MDGQTFNADHMYLNYDLYCQRHGRIEFENWLEIAEPAPGTKFTEEQKEALRQAHVKYSGPEGTRGQAPPYF
jgi:hypothetical protein